MNFHDMNHFEAMLRKIRGKQREILVVHHHCCGFFYSLFAPQLWQVTCQDGSQSHGSFCVHGGSLKLLKPQHRHQSVLLTAGWPLNSPTPTLQQNISRKYGLNFNKNSMNTTKQATRSRNWSTTANQSQHFGTIIFIMIIIVISVRLSF